MTPARPPHRPSTSEPSSLLPAWGAWCFFASGAAGLIYEVVWSKQLSYILGSSLHAVATVVAAFLCGLALGARFLGVPLARRGRGGRVYAVLEMGVGALGIASLPMLRGIEPLVGQLYRGLGGEGPAFAFARFAILFAVLIPPAALMGATLPVLVGHFERRLVGPALARLYALNTFGAVAGSVVSGFVLLPSVGLAATTWIAAALNAMVAAIAWRASDKARAGAAAADAPVTGDVVAPIGALAGAQRVVFALMFALSGFAALAFQIAWVRLFSLVLGSSVYSFSAVLGVYLLGLALGSALISGFMRKGVSLTGFARLQLALAVIAALQLSAFSKLPDAMYDLASRSGANWSGLFAGEVLLVAGMLIVPCALLGAIFPVATRLLQREDGGHAAGSAYAVNTAGTIAGSLAAGFVMVPTWGVQGTHLAAVAISAAIGLTAMAIARSRRESTGTDLVLTFGALAAVGVFSMIAPRWDPALMNAGAYRPTQANTLAQSAQLTRGTGPTVWRATRDERVLYYREGLNGSVLVGTDAEGKERWLRVGGKIDASTADMETQVLLGLIPAALADSGARTLVVGLGSGATAAAALAAGAGPTEIVELEPGVVEASRFFHETGHNPLDDPRVTLVVGDARAHLEHSDTRYGLIISEPSNPWIAGVNNLFTVDFYRRVKSRLATGGVFCQWMQLYELSPETFSTLIASFLEVFPEGHVFAVWRAVDLLLIATPDSRALSLERLSSPEGRRMLAVAKVSSPEAIAAYYGGSFTQLRPIAQGSTLNRDDRPVVEYRAPRDLVAIGRTTAFGHPDVIGRVPFAGTPPQGPLFSAWTGDGWYEARARRLIELGEIVRAQAVVRGAAGAGATALAARLTEEIAAGDRRKRGLDLVDQAMTLNSAGREVDARRVLERAAETDPANGRTWLMLADRRRLVGDLEGAEAARVRGAASADPEVQLDAEMIGGLIEIARKRPQVAAERFRAAQDHAPGLSRAYVLESNARASAGDPAGARRALERGLVALPGNAEISAALARLGTP